LDERFIKQSAAWLGLIGKFLPNAPRSINYTKFPNVCAWHAYPVEYYIRIRNVDCTVRVYKNVVKYFVVYIYISFCLPLNVVTTTERRIAEEIKRRSEFRRFDRVFPKRRKIRRNRVSLSERIYKTRLFFVVPRKRTNE